MIEFLSEYSLFLAKAVTIVFAVLAVVVGIAIVSTRSRKEGKQGDIEVIHFNDELAEMKEALEGSILDECELKAMLKEEKKKAKADKKSQKKAPPADDQPRRKRIFVLDFDGGY